MKPTACSTCDFSPAADHGPAHAQTLLFSATFYDDRGLLSTIQRLLPAPLEEVVGSR